MRLVLAAIDHEAPDGIPTPEFEEFVRDNLPVGTRVTVEWDGMFIYADVVA